MFTARTSVVLRLRLPTLIIHKMDPFEVDVHEQHTSFCDNSISRRGEEVTSRYTKREFYSTTTHVTLLPEHRKAHGYGKSLSQVRKWENSEDFMKLENEAFREEKEHLNFTLMSYNVLAQEYIETIPHLYRECDSRDLQWSNRKERLINQFRKSRSDIVCLQEVQAEHYHTFFLPMLQIMGYEGIFKQKTGGKVDGCATFYKKDKFILREEHSVEYLKKGVNVLDRDNVALIAILAAVANVSKEICIANTHLLFNPKREDVRLAQLQLLLAEIDHVAYRDSRYLPVIFCGDLNLEPSSSLYSFLSEGRLKYEHLEHRRLTPQGSKKVGKSFLPTSLEVSDSCQHLKALEGRSSDCEPVFASGTLTHALGFKSVYNSEKFPKDNSRRSFVSTFQDHWNLVDYIFYSENGCEESCDDRELVLLRRLRLPSEDDCRRFGHLPNSQNGSDHYHLEAKFRWNFEVKTE